MSHNRSGPTAKRTARWPSRPDTPPDPKQTPLGDPKERVRIAIQGLKVLGVRQDQIDSITTHDDPEALLPLLAPISGHVIKKNVYEGQYAFEETVLFEIADLSRVWVDAQVYEDQLALVRLGQPIEATVPAFPGEVFKGTVALIAPVLDPATRTAAVRLDLDNPDLRLRPGMYAKVTLNVALGGPTRTRGAEEQTTCPVTRVSLGSMGPATPGRGRGANSLGLLRCLRPEAEVRAREVSRAPRFLSEKQPAECAGSGGR